ncbi:MAG: fatty acid--CoA ligase family protein, partial [Gammaproteobacteria bacterium]|nr:fatty acid--CoA ligase family protein [Gammaproteobacteria bacterium]
ALLSWELDARAGALMKGLEFQTPESQPVTLLAVPLFHATGSHAVYLASYRAQRRIVCMYKWDVVRAAEVIERERVSSFIAPAAMTGDLVEFARKEACDLSSLAVVGGGGAPRAPEQVRNIEQIFANAMPGTGWGMTETNAIGTGIGGVDYLERPESSGRGSAVLDLRVVDEKGNELPTGARGELLIRGTSVIRGYWNRPDANAETFVDGWLRTGDVAYLDDDGFLFIVDRIKDLVIRGGENIGCGAIESVLLEHPSIMEASVYSVPDERLGEEVGTTVYTRKPITETALRTFLETRLARFEVPRYVHFSDTPLPRTASGKILKRQLREDACARLSR